MKTKHFKFETLATNLVISDFLSKICALSTKVEKFDLGFEGFILSITAEFDDSCETENADPSDVIHNFRKQITKIKEYSRKPTPQKEWTGVWVNLKS